MHACMQGQASGVNVAAVSQSLSGAIRGIAQPFSQSDLFGNISFIATGPQRKLRVRRLMHVPSKDVSRLAQLQTCM